MTQDQLKRNLYRLIFDFRKAIEKANQILNKKEVSQEDVDEVIDISGKAASEIYYETLDEKYKDNDKIPLSPSYFIHDDGPEPEDDEY